MWHGDTQKPSLETGKRNTPQKRRGGPLAVGTKAEHWKMEREPESPAGAVCGHLHVSMTLQGKKSLAGGGGGGRARGEWLETRLREGPRPV